MKTKYLWILAVLMGLTACESDDSITTGTDEPLPELTAGEADFSTYVAVGASFSAGFTDGALFIAGQQNSFPNMLSQKFALTGGGEFNQPLMADNIGGFLFGGTPMYDSEGNRQFGPRLFFDGSGPTPHPLESTTEATTPVSGPFNNYGVPGVKSFHLGIEGYGMLNPYFGRMASSPTATVLGDAITQGPSFFTLSEIGGNDVLAYATSGGSGVDQTGNMDPTTYANNDITDPDVFAASFSGAVDALTANGAKGVVANVPYITSLAHFTTVPHNPLDPSNPDFGPQIPTLNTVFGAINGVFDALGHSDRAIVFHEDQASAVVIKDESLENISADITLVLNNSPTFPAFIGQFGLPPEAAPLVANLLGQMYGQCRQATDTDLFVLPSSAVIGAVNEANVAFLMGQGMSQQLAGMFSLEGITYAMDDQWALIPEEQQSIMTATDAYNQTIQDVADAKDLALVDFKSLLQSASTTGFSDSSFNYNTELVTGGLISLDGVHLTARGYAVMGNAILKAIDATYGSNFEASGNLIDSGNFPALYPADL